MRGPAWWKRTAGSCVLIGTEEKVSEKPVDNWLELTGGTLCMIVNSLVVRSLAAQKNPSKNVKQTIKRYTRLLTKCITQQLCNLT